MGKRFKNNNWSLTENSDGTVPWDAANLALLMDLRDELQAIRVALAPLRHLECANFQMIPSKLDAIRRNTRKPRRTSRK